MPLLFSSAHADVHTAHSPQITHPLLCVSKNSGCNLCRDFKLEVIKMAKSVEAEFGVNISTTEKSEKSRSQEVHPLRRMKSSTQLTWAQESLNILFIKYMGLS